MVRIEMKKIAEGQVMLGIEAKGEKPDEVLTCAARGFVGVARHLLGPMATNPQFVEEISRGIKEMLLDTEDLKVTRGVEGKEAKFMAALYGMNAGGAEMKLEEYEQIMRTGTPSDRARAIAAASDDKELSEEDFHQLTALIKGAVRPTARKMTPDEAKLWAEVSRVNTRLKQEMVEASFTVRALPGDLQEDAINILSKTVSGMLGDLTRLMAETGEP